ncbi:TPR repeat region-containing protein [Mycolicibacterium helvum]|uniref:TPR repeat domain-containing protein n=1 Tax=Mycolicibacterium helvum TaxID=1534349 RepID=A0A7I7T3C5_9MYCO|nr:hypothetical protein [Mycolicibacterium helvum]BBY63460.1 hypothetical protein MHEL_17030 [Mycolicibacterium helvum]
MGISLTDLEAWDPGSLRAVATAATGRANQVRDVAHNQQDIITKLVWEGNSFEQASTMAMAISNTMLAHADECDQAARDVSSAASEVESIKSEWSRIQHMADHWGIVIDTATGEMHYIIPDDPEERAEVERHVQIVHDAIVDLLRRADSTDQHLAAAVNNAISETADGIGNDPNVSPEVAKETVAKALAGDQGAAAEVKAVLGSINEGQRAGTEPLTPTQASILSQMQAQQAGMSTDALGAAEQNMGDAKSAMGDSWQLMSNPNIHFPKTDPGGVANPNNMTSGGMSQLPRSVQGVLQSKGMSQLGEMTKVTDIVKDGNAGLRQGGTALDRGMLNKATEMMNSPTFHGTPVGGKGGYSGIAGDGVPVANGVLATAGQDHQAVHDIVRDSAYSDNFMKGALGTDWGDNGKAVGDMFGWTGDAANGPDAKVAAETASAYGAYVGDPKHDFLHMPGNQTLGELNPEAVRGLSHGLAPYIPDIAEASAGRHQGFGLLDTDETNMPVAKNIFSVLSTDKAASDYFNGAAGRDIMQAQLDYANDYKNGVDMASNNHRLYDSMTMQGLVDSGIHNATGASHINEEAMATAAYEAKKSAYEFGFAGLDAAGVPGTDLVSQAFEDALLGDPPKTKGWDTHSLPNLDLGQGENQVLNALARAGVPIQGLDDQFLAPPDPNHPEAPRRILSAEEYAANRSGTISGGEYNDAIRRALIATTGRDLYHDIDVQMSSRYNAVTETTQPPQ